MKRVIGLVLLGLFVASSASADIQTITRKRNDATHVCVPMKTTSTGKLISALADITCSVSLETEGSAPASFATTGDTTESEVATSSGLYCIDLTAGETNADYIWLKCVSATGGIEDQWVQIVTHLELGDVNVTAGVTNQTAVTFAGNGTGAGIFSQGGATGDGIHASGKATAYTSQGGGFTADGGNQGIYANGGVGATISGLTTGNGMTITSGPGATGNALQLTAASTNGSGLGVTGTGTAPGALISGGRNGLRVVAGANGYAGAQFEGLTTGAGINLVPGATGSGLQIAGGATSGNGIDVSTTSGDAIKLTPAGTGKVGINCGAAVCLQSSGSLFSGSTPLAVSY